jgi:tetratricopeptide (TPR) repeat protein
MKLSVTIFAVCLSLSSVVASAESVDELIKRGDQCAQSYQEEAAIDFYLSAAKHDPKNAYLQVVISREYRHLMSDAGSKGDKLRYAKIALEHALQAAKLGPTNTEAQLAPAITYGKILPLTDDSGEKLKVSRKIKSAADRAIALDANNDTAWHILGCWHRGFIHGDIPESTFADAAACFRKAIEINPNRLMHQVELGRVYCAMGKKSEAKKLIQCALVMTETEKDDPETKRHGRETLRKL